MDEKGRLKLPAEFTEYLEKAGVTKVFITTVDLLQVRIYPLPLWQRNENLFDNAGEHASEAERLARFAKHYGGDAEIDKTGRVLLPALLRQEMGLEKQAVCVDAYGGRINVVSKKMHDEMMSAAKVSRAEDLKALMKLGFK